MLILEYAPRISWRCTTDTIACAPPILLAVHSRYARCAPPGSGICIRVIFTTKNHDFCTTVCRHSHHSVSQLILQCARIHTAV